MTPGEQRPVHYVGVYAVDHFGINLPVNWIVFARDTGHFYRLDAAALYTDTLATVANTDLTAGGIIATAWSLLGNAGTVAGTNFIGTTDNKPFNIRVNNVQAGRIDPILFNAFYGYQTGASNTTGGANSAFGDNALRLNERGRYNTANGGYSLYNTIFNSCIGLGYMSGYYNVSSNRLYINSIDRINAAGDEAKSIIYGVQDAALANQHLYLNASTHIQGTTLELSYQSVLGKIAITTVFGAANKTLTITNTALTDDRIATFQNASGTIAYLTDIPAADHSILANRDIAGNHAKLIPAANSTTAIQLCNAASTSILNVDTTNSRIGINNTTPSQALDVTGSIKGSLKAVVPGTSGGLGQGFFTGDFTNHLGAFQSLNAGGNTYSFIATNKYYTGAGWTDNGLGRVGSSFQIINDSFIFYRFNTAAVFTAAFQIMSAAAGGIMALGSAVANASLSLPAGTTTAKTAPIFFTVSGADVLATPVVGMMEVKSDDIYYTISTGTARKKFVLADPVAGLTDGRLPFCTTTGRLTDASTLLATATTISLVSDAGYMYFGGGSDMRVFYNSVEGVIDTSLVAPSDLLIGCGTDKTLLLSESVWDDVQFSISTGKVPASNYPDYDTFTTNTKEFKFDVDDYIDLECNEMPHWWKEATTVKPHLHLTLDGSNTSGANQYVKFTIYFAYAKDDAVWTETTSTVERTIANGTADMTNLFGTGTDVTMVGLPIGTQVKIRIKRIAATAGTEYPNHIFVTQCGVHAEKDTMGSRQVGTK